MPIVKGIDFDEMNEKWSWSWSCSLILFLWVIVPKPPSPPLESTFFSKPSNAKFKKDTLEPAKPSQTSFLAHKLFHPFHMPAFFFLNFWSSLQGPSKSLSCEQGSPWQWTNKLKPKPSVLISVIRVLQSRASVVSRFEIIRRLESSTRQVLNH